MSTYAAWQTKGLKHLTLTSPGVTGPKLLYTLGGGGGGYAATSGTTSSTPSVNDSMEAVSSDGAAGAGGTLEAVEGVLLRTSPACEAAHKSHLLYLLCLSMM